MDAASAIATTGGGGSTRGGRTHRCPGHPAGLADVWICGCEDGHLVATGADERGRTQYLYHARWRTLRDELNFYRLVDLGPRLPPIRADIDQQVRRRTLDRELVLARDAPHHGHGGLRMGREEYAEENDSYGLTTLTKRHGLVRGSRRRASASRPSPEAGRGDGVGPGSGCVVSAAARPTRADDCSPSTAAGRADQVNDRLAELAGARVTAKDFRTWTAR